MDWWDSFGRGWAKIPGSPHHIGSDVENTQTLWWGEKDKASPLSPQTAVEILQSFYSGPGEHILTGSITAWFGNSSAQDRRAVQRVLRSDEHTIGTTLPCLQDLYTRRCRTRAWIMKDSHHPNNRLFQLLRSSKRLCTHTATTERLRWSFFPKASRAGKSDLTRTPIKFHTWPLLCTHRHTETHHNFYRLTCCKCFTFTNSVASFYFK